MAHQASRWQIAVEGTDWDSSTGFASTVFDSGADASNLLTYPAAGTLTPGVAYVASLQWQSDTDDWGPWATPDAFTTTAESPFADPNLRVNATGQTTAVAEIDSTDETWEAVQWETTGVVDTRYDAERAAR